MNTGNRSVARGPAVLVALLCLPLAARAQGGCTHSHGGHWLGETRSPGFAAALSLLPMPLDLGNFYAERPGWGVAYTAVEVVVFLPMMVLLADGPMHDASNNDEWTGGERAAFYGLLGGYVAVKAVAALHASHNARAYNTRVQAEPPRAMVAPTHNGLALAMRF